MHRNGDGYRFNKVRIERSAAVIGDKFSSRGAQGDHRHHPRRSRRPVHRERAAARHYHQPALHALPDDHRAAQRELLEGSPRARDIRRRHCVQPTRHRRHSERAAALHYSSNGDEVLYDGVTGDDEMPIFIGPTFYQRLKHMVNDKVPQPQHRPDGSLTRRLPGPQSRRGALWRDERDCVLSHGASNFIKRDARLQRPLRDVRVQRVRHARERQPREAHPRVPRVLQHDRLFVRADSVRVQLLFHEL